MRPSAVLDPNRIALREIVSRYRAANPRIFGSVLRGQDHDENDIDLLADALPGATLFDLGGLQEEPQALLGLPVDVLTPGELPANLRSRVLADAQPV
jgi:predicted nucleotidyltransferase